VAFAAAVWLRVAVGGATASVSAPAGLIFAAALTALTLAAGAATRLSWRTVCCGIGGAIVVCLPPALIRLAGDSHRPAGHYLPWAATVTVVAIAEEAFLRGALYDALETWSWPRSSGRHSGRPPWVALLTTSLCFAALHVPLYGWHAAPLDAAVGLWLGALRYATGTWTAPALCHVLADLASWWLR
jgi:membrane protease YdiL (CAAX protease family)